MRQSLKAEKERSRRSRRDYFKKEKKMKVVSKQSKISKKAMIETMVWLRVKSQVKGREKFIIWVQSQL